MVEFVAKLLEARCVDTWQSKGRRGHSSLVISIKSFECLRMSSTRSSLTMKLSIVPRDRGPFSIGYYKFYAFGRNSPVPRRDLENSASYFALPRGEERLSTLCTRTVSPDTSSANISTMFLHLFGRFSPSNDTALVCVPCGCCGKILSGPDGRSAVPDALSHSPILLTWPSLLPADLIFPPASAAFTASNSLPRPSSFNVGAGLMYGFVLDELEVPSVVTDLILGSSPSVGVIREEMAGMDVGLIGLSDSNLGGQGDMGRF